MVRGWDLKLIDPVSSVRIAIQTAWKHTLSDLQLWIESELVPALINGGFGIKGIAQTDFYKFISSSKGLSELGIEQTEPPKLLLAYANSVKVSHNNNMILLRFGDTAQLRLGTPHPASGTGFLQIQSWLEWVLDGVTVNSGFVPRTKLPSSAQKNIRISSAPGGLMLPKGLFGSKGLWRFPTKYKNYDSIWLINNFKAIEKAIMDKVTFFLSKRLK